MPSFSDSVIFPDWPAPQNIHALTTTKNTIVENLNLPSEPIWLNQIHGSNIVAADEVRESVDADASYTQKSHIICVIRTADCLPILICDKKGSCVAAIHAGWRGLAAGVIESTIQKIPALPEDILAWFGPAIGLSKFEVGFDVCEKFPENQAVFKTISNSKYLCNIFLLARQRLEKLGVNNIYGGTLCTYSDVDRFYSHRRSKDTGRMLSLIWLSHM